MTAKEIIEQLEKLDPDAQVKVAEEGNVWESPIINIIIEAGEATIEYRDEE